MNAISLFSGIGGIDLACEWAGIKTVAFCEIEPFCQRVLRKHWPGVPIIEDVRDVTREELDLLGIGANDLISAGFPCQPFSHAGKREGTEDERYLWPEVVRVLADIRPTWFVGENVTGLLSMAQPDRELEVVSQTVARTPEEDFYEAVYTQQEDMLINDICQDLENIGYAVQVFSLPASAIGASHQRDRVFIVGYTEHDGLYGAKVRRSIDSAGNNIEEGTEETSESEGASGRKNCATMAHTNSGECSEWMQRRIGEDKTEIGTGADDRSAGLGEDTELMADASSAGRKERHASAITGESGYGSRGGDPVGAIWAAQPGMGGGPYELSDRLDGWGMNPLDALINFISSFPQPALMGQDQFDWEPPRLATGVKNRAARLRALGNAVDPLQIYPIMYAIRVIDDWLREGRA